jgi:hypothetical protein
MIDQGEVVDYNCLDLERSLIKAPVLGAFF